MSTKESAATKPEKVAPLNQTRLKESGFVRNVWSVTPPAGEPFKNLASPEYWCHIGAMLKPGDRIDAMPEDGTWFAELLVLSSARLWAKVHVLSHHDLQGAKEDMPLTDDENHTVSWKGPIAKFAVIRKSDSTIIKEGFSTKLDGYQWLEGHLKSLAA